MRGPGNRRGIRRATRFTVAVVAAAAVGGGALVYAGESRNDTAADTADAADAAAPATSSAPAAAPAPEPLPAPPDWDYSTVIGYTGDDTEMHLTFDDGPGKDTPAILDILDRYNVKATFCMTGRQTDEEPDIGRQVLARGHLLCNHSYSHLSSINRGNAAGITAEINKANDAFARQYGAPQPTYYRAPEGVFNGQVPTALAGLKMRALGWAVDSRDWTKPGVDAIVNNVLSQVGPGKIVLMHDAGGTDRTQTVAALPRIIEGIRAAGYRLTTPR